MGRPPQPMDKAAAPRTKRKGNPAQQVRRRTLAAVMKEILQVGESEHIEREVGGVSDRAAALICACNLDVALDFGILARMTYGNVKGRDILAYRELLSQQHGALSSMFGKIDLALALGVYGAEYRKSLHIIRTIRNVFAHAALPVTFVDEARSQQCHKLNNGVIIRRTSAKDVVISQPHFSFERFLFSKCCTDAANEIANNSLTYSKAQLSES